MKIGDDFQSCVPAFRPEAIKGVRIEHTDAGGVRFRVKVVVENPTGDDAPTLFALTQQKGTCLMMFSAATMKLIHAL
jgi:hypothetical protein